MPTTADVVVLAGALAVLWLIYWGASRLALSMMMRPAPRQYSQAETELCDCGALERDEKHYDECPAAGFERR